MPEEGTHEGGVQKDEGRLAAGKCDKNGKPIGVNSLTATGATQPLSQASYAPSLASTIPMQQMVPCVLRESLWQSGVSADRSLVHQHDRTGPENSWLQAWTEQNTRCWILDLA